jgi:hypothetical protein
MLNRVLPICKVQIFIISFISCKNFFYAYFVWIPVEIGCDMNFFVAIFFFLMYIFMIQALLFFLCDLKEKGKKIDYAYATRFCDVMVKGLLFLCVIFF